MLLNIKSRDIFFLGFILRLIYYFRPRSFWGDEWFTIDASSKPLLEAIKRGINDVHPPLQFIIFHFGGYRFFPFLAGLASLYFFTKLTKDRLAIFLFAVSPYFIHLSGETRGYGFLCLFSILVLSGYKWAFPLALLTEHTAIFMLLVSFAVWYIPFLIGSAGLIYYQSAIEGVSKASRGFEWALLPVIKKFFGLFIQWAGGITFSFLTTKQGVSAFLFGGAGLFLIPAFCFLPFSRNKKNLILLSCAILIMFLFYPIRLNARYLPFCGVVFILLITEGYRNLKFKFKPVLMALYCIILVAHVFKICIMPSDAYHREDYREALKILQRDMKEGDALIGARNYVEYYANKNSSKYEKILNAPKLAPVIWEVYQGNPDENVNNKHIKWQEKDMNVRCAGETRASELVYVFKYERSREI
ncbi:glycosyl transferase family 39 [Candidatus Omnitrophus magneticus]|uniref:Glycosyl transferase family 39 n=1 Tax=Candidatus Omnitrophus magneticus TaxID=1609969 RepID=A0A0F0CX65_9BACT|nr:glycosyl transferase family 39 [Candidatus Omnitrophus magneticus]